MTLALRSLKVYLKLTAIGAVAVVVLLVILMNRHNTADIWLFRRYEDVNVLSLIAVTSVVAVSVWWGVRKLFKVIRELREVRHLTRQERERQSQRQLADELAEREKRIDEKVRRSITEET